MLKIAIGLNFYQDFHSLQRLLHSLNCCAFDRIIAVDGKYIDWPKELDPGCSSRDCLDLFEGIEKQTPVTYIAAANRTQVQKRQMYMDACENLGIDVIVILDTDDYIVCEQTDYRSFKEDLEYKIMINKDYRLGYCIPCQMWDQWPHPNLGGQIQNICRVFYKPHTLRYAENHYTLRDKKTGVCQVYTGAAVCQHIEMVHDHSLRDTHYQSDSTVYSKALYELENPGKRADSFNRY